MGYILTISKTLSVPNSVKSSYPLESACQKNLHPIRGFRPGPHLRHQRFIWVMAPVRRI